MKRILVLVTVLFTASNVFSAGFRLAEQSARANGMGNAFVAINDDVSAAWYNPAALTDLEKTQVSLGTVMVAPEMEHKNLNGTTDKIAKRLHTPPQLYAAHKLNEKISLSFGFNAPFGLQTNWGDASATKYIATLSDIKALNGNINAAYALNEKLSLAAGLNYIYVDAILNSKHPTIPGNPRVEMTGDGTGTGYNLAAFYKLNDKWNLGANYRSQMEVDVDGNLEVVGFSKSDAETTLTLPDTFQIGAAYKMNEKWLFSAAADYTNWTTYRRLIIKTPTTTSTYNKNWKSVWAYRLGTEYKYSDALKLRGGFFYDLNPVEEKYFENRVPDSDRMAFSVGAGYSMGNITLDFSYMYLHFMERKIDSSDQDNLFGNVLNGKYHAFAHLPAFSITYKF